MSAQVQEGVWLPLLEYAHRKGLSLSTLRRYIKSDKVTYRLEKGRYRIWDPMGVVNESASPVLSNSNPNNSYLNNAQDGRPVSTSTGNSFSGQSLENLKLIEKVSALEAELNRTRIELKKLKEEAVELKMLIAFYEEGASKAPTPTRSL